MKKKVISTINVTPFVDVMLVLLVVFMISAPMMSSVIEVNLPHTNSKGNPKELNNSKIAMVTVKKNGEVFVQDKATKISQIKSEIESFFAGEEGKVFIRGDKDATYETVARTIAAIKNSGISNISLVTNTEL